MRLILPLFLSLLAVVMSLHSKTLSRTVAKRFATRMTSDASFPQETRTFTGYSLYKSKGAVQVKPIAPTRKSENGIRTVMREGTLLFEFAPPGKNPREYDWSKKLTFSLNPTELGELVNMKESDSLNLLHNPNLGGIAKLHKSDFQNQSLMSVLLICF